jgi:hypothetical protein
MAWRTFLRAHWPALVTADFFTTEVLTARGLVTYYTAFVIELQGHRQCVDRPSACPAGNGPHSMPSPSRRVLSYYYRAAAQDRLDGVLGQYAVPKARKRHAARRQQFCP